MIRSPSQWPGTARSSASAGRSLISTSGVTCALAPFCVPRAGHPQRPAGAQARDQLTLERAAALDVQRLVDRLVADAHGLIIGEVDPEPVRDLLRAPRRRPSPVLRCGLLRPFQRGLPGPATGVPSGGATSPASRSWTYSRSRSLRDQLRGLRAPRAPLGLPLRDRRPVLQLAAPGRRVAAQLARDRRRVAAEPAGDLTHADALGPAAARSPHARRTTGSGPTPSRADRVSCRQRDETTAAHRPATRRPRRRVLVVSPRRSPPRT